MPLITRACALRRPGDVARTQSQLICNDDSTARHVRHGRVGERPGFARPFSSTSSAAHYRRPRWFDDLFKF
jgi:hypothetical protein